ncbi:MAG: thioesterase [Actinomyces sp.]|nr:MAG: thioesterase [Actinomyces sp.]
MTAIGRHRTAAAHRAAAIVPAVPLEPGLRAQVTHVVGDGDLAPVFGSGSVPVLATPRVLAWCEEATMAALADQLPEGETSVGMRVQLDHVQPTPNGAEVRAEATLERVEGRRLTFAVAVHDPRGLVAAGRVTRVIVDRERFLAKAG